MDYELKEHVQIRNGQKLENIDIRMFRKWMTQAQKSCAQMVDAISQQSQALRSATPNVKAPKQKKKKPKKKQGKTIEDDDSFLDAIIAENSVDQARYYDKIKADLDDTMRVYEADKAAALELNQKDKKVLDEISVLFNSRLEEMRLVKKNTMSGPKPLPDQTIDRGNFFFYHFTVIEGDQNDKEHMKKYWADET